MYAFPNDNIKPLLFQMMEDFSGLALPPLFGEHILEAELEPGGVELGPGEVISLVMDSVNVSKFWICILLVIAFTKSMVTSLKPISRSCSFLFFYL